jgi:hypothetical protein
MRTSLYSILCIVVRLGAICLAVGTLSSLLALLVSWRAGTEVADLGFSIGFVALMLWLAFMLWVFPGTLARIAAGRSSQQVFESPISAAQIQWIAFSVLGMYFVISGVVGLSYYVIRYLRAGEMIGYDQVAAFMSDGLYWIVQIALGAVLALGARGLVGVLYRIRYGNMSQSSEQAQ